MAHSSAGPLGVGVIGLGPIWRRRYRRALLRLRDRFRLVAVCDQVREQAQREADRQGCHAAAGPTELIENPRVEAVLLLDPQWYRLWPAHAACRAGKPTFSCAALDPEDPRGNDLYQALRAGQIPLTIETAPRHTPAFRQLQELLAGGLGPARAVSCALAESHDSSDVTRPAEIAGVVSCCRSLLPGPFVSVVAAGSEPARFATWLTQIGERCSLQVTRFRVPLQRGRVRIQVVAERGTATADLPRRLRWRDARGLHGLVANAEAPAAQTMLERFYRVTHAGAEPDASLDEVHRLLSWSRAAAQSLREGKLVEIPQMEN